MELVRIIILARNSSPPQKKMNGIGQNYYLARNSSPPQKMNGIGQNYYFSKKLFSPQKKIGEKTEIKLFMLMPAFKYYYYNNYNNYYSIKRTCLLVNFAISADHKMKLKDSEKSDKYLDLARELKMSMTVMPVEIGSLGTILKGFGLVWFGFKAYQPL